jgi:hypothetical protein
MKLKPETVAAIQGDEFARKTIEATRSFIYANYRDWEHVSRNGNLRFTNDDMAVAYLALGELLGTQEPPDMSGVTVQIGGTSIACEALDALQAAFTK